jgi:hypothetical protein
MFIEKIDLLILTETHSDCLTNSRKTLTLAQSGAGTSSARVAILAQNNGSWSADQMLWFRTLY